MDVKYFSQELLTNRIVLRKFKSEDARDIMKILKHKEVAATTLMLPYPCNIKEANKIVDNYLNEQKHQNAMHWAIALKGGGKFMGSIRLVPNTTFNSAELGFWIGKEFWGNGYTFEAASEVIKFGFEELKLNRIEAHSMVENKSSIKLLEKLSFGQEGYHPDLVIKWKEYKDVMTFGLLRKNYLLINNFSGIN